MIRSRASVSRDVLTGAIDKTLAYLRRCYRQTNGQAGWYHFLDDLAPGVTASAVGLRTFSMAGTAFENRAAVSAYLISQQVRADGSTDGGWPVRTTRGHPVVEATGWVVRALTDARAAGSPSSTVALARGCHWLTENQNTDNGWGPSAGQRSRTFTTALSLLALAEAGADAELLARGAEWLVSTQDPTEPAWGPVPGAPPTMLHTAFALHALSSIGKKLPAESIDSTAQWLLERITPGQHAEPETISEDYDVEYVVNDETLIYQNSLPHFATPVTIAALSAVGVDLLQVKVFDECTAILDDQTPDGIWRLPKSPMRPSIWSIWPFVAALAAMRGMCVPHPQSRLHLVSPGLALHQTTMSDRQMTRRMILSGAVVDLVRRKWVSLLLGGLIAAATVVPFWLWLEDAIDGATLMLSLVVPAAMATAQVVFEHKRGA